MASKGSPSNLDQILEQYVGGVGKYQVFVLLVLYHLSWGGHFYHVYTAYAPDHRCRVPICEAQNQSKMSDNIYEADWLKYAVPSEKHSSNFLDSKNKYDGCSMYKPVEDEEVCHQKSFNQSETIPCTEYIYDNTFFDETLATKLNLVCGDAHYKSLLGTLLIVALLFGSLIGGRLGDQFGRKKMFFASTAVTVPIVIGLGYVQNYETYASLYFIYMLCIPVGWVNISSYVTELFTSKWRFVNYLVGTIPVTPMVFALVLYLNRTFTGVHLCCGLLTMVILPFYFVLPESPRWLAQNDKEDEAVKVLLTMAKVNGRKLNDNDKCQIEKLIKDIATESHETEDNLTPLDMLRHGNLFKTLNLWFAWIMACVSFYAISLNAADLSGNIILNYVLTKLTGIPQAGIIAISMNKLGRKNTLTLSHIFLGICLLGLAFIPKVHSTVILIVYLLSDMLAGISFSMVYLITTELYPTNLRVQAVGMSSAVSRVFCACAPYLGPLAKIWQPLPMLIIGVPIILSGLLASKLPETYNEDLPQTMKGAIELEEKQHQQNMVNNNA